MARIPFPNEKIDLGTQAPWIRDFQNALGAAETGVYDFLTMCHVIVHKFKNGLNHQDPTVDQSTWNSVMDKAHGVDQPNARGDQAPDPAATAGAEDNRAAADRREATGGTERSPRDGIATVGQINRTDDNAAPDQNYRATTTGATNATDENTPPISRPDTNPDAPREDQPTVTAGEQQAAGGVAGGYTAAPTDNAANAPSPAEQAAGVQSTEQENNGGGAVTP
jgi:hypothetical protein